MGQQLGTQATTFSIQTVRGEELHDATVVDASGNPQHTEDYSEDERHADTYEHDPDPHLDLDHPVNKRLR